MGELIMKTSTDDCPGYSPDSVTETRLQFSGGF